MYKWVLVEAHLGRAVMTDRVCARGQRITDFGNIFEITLPISFTGCVYELIQLPDGVTDMSLQVTLVEPVKTPIHIRQVSLIERTWLMMDRIYNTCTRLTREQRVRVGLSLWKIIIDLAGAYRIASQFRLSPLYAQWIERCDQFNDQDVRQIRRQIANFNYAPHFHVLLNMEGASHEAIRATLEALRNQLFQNFTCVVLHVSSGGNCSSDFEAELRDLGMNSCVVTQPQVTTWLDQLNAALAHQGQWVLLLRPGDVLASHALNWFACAALVEPNTTILYADDDLLNADSARCQPRFKPDWSLSHFRATNFIGDAAALRGKEVAASGGITLDCCRHGNYDLLLRVIDEGGDDGERSVAHIPAVLMHKRHISCPDAPSREGRGPEAQSTSQWNLNVLQAHLIRNRVKAEVSETLPGCWRVRYHLPEALPLVSIVIPTRDQLKLIRQCIESILEKTTYPRLEILVVDNQSDDPEALSYLAQIDGQNGIRILHYDEPFNYSAINNFAVGEAKGEVLCLLNNDTEVITSDWLEEMVGHLLQPKVGVVGAKLYFPDGRVQHAGDTVGPGGTASHLHSFIEQNAPGYCNRAAVAQELSAVTGACMVVWKSIYERLHGLNEKHLPVAFNDVDFCLRVREAGFRVVWTPHAELYHHESVSRGKDKSPEKIRRAKREVAYMRKRWKQVMKNDPFYNPNLSYFRADFSLSIAPMVTKPWQR